MRKRSQKRTVMVKRFPFEILPSLSGKLISQVPFCPGSSLADYPVQKMSVRARRAEFARAGRLKKNSHSRAKARACPSYTTATGPNALVATRCFQILRLRRAGLLSSAGPILTFGLGLEANKQTRKPILFSSFSRLRLGSVKESTHVVLIDGNVRRSDRECIDENGERATFPVYRFEK